MITLTIGNSTSRLSGLTAAQFKAIRDVLSYTLPPSQTFYMGGHRSPKRYLMDAKGAFPSGLIKQVQDWLSTNTIPHTLVDTRKRPTGQPGRFKLNLPHIPYQLQYDAMYAALHADRGTISACTGFGKSILIALLVQLHQMKTLIVVPNLTLKTQLIDSFRQYFGSLDNIQIENIDSPNLNKDSDHDLLIIDEAHHVAARTYRTLNRKRWGGIFHRFYLTATPFRSRDEENILMESVAGQVIFTVGYREAMELGAVVPVEAYYYELPKVKTQADTWAGVYKALVVGRVDRNALIADLLKSLHAAGKSTLCLVKEIAHGELLASHTGAAFANGQSDDCAQLIEWFNAGKIKTLIGTVGVLGEGVDTRPAEYVVIAGLGKSKPAFMQNVGRAIRRYPGKDTAKVILFRDDSHKWTKAHFKAQVQTLRDEYGTEPVLLTP